MTNVCREMRYLKEQKGDLEVCYDWRMIFLSWQTWIFFLNDG